MRISDWSSDLCSSDLVLHTVSVNPDIDPDIPAMIGASAALAISGIPFNGPIGAARVGYVDGQYVLNPTATQLKSSKMDLIVAGTENKSEERRVGKECVRTCRSRWTPYN